MNTAIDNYFKVHTKTWFRFLPKRRKYRQRTSRNFHDRKSERRKIDSHQNNNCVFKKLNDGNTIYLPPKIKGLVIVLSGLLFYCLKRNLFSVTVGFVTV
jgi:hypothetical protein